MNTPIQPPTRKQEIAAEIERQRNAQVIHVNEPNPVLMQVAMDEIIAANLHALEEQEQGQRAQAADVRKQRRPARRAKARAKATAVKA
jgi:hypothetical protein